VVFEDSNDDYSLACGMGREDPTELIRAADLGVTRLIAHASLHLEHLSAAFLADARDFFPPTDAWNLAATLTTLTWERLVSLTLTSQLLSPDHDDSEINDLLQQAGAAAKRMPPLKIMEPWNGRMELACVFRYRAPRAWDRPAELTWKSTWDFGLEERAIAPWRAVAAQNTARCASGLQVNVESIDGSGIRSHGDAIPLLQLETEVARPVSLRQMKDEARYLHAC